MIAIRVSLGVQREGGDQIDQHGDHTHHELEAEIQPDADAVDIVEQCADEIAAPPTRHPAPFRPEQHAEDPLAQSVHQLMLQTRRQQRLRVQDDRAGDDQEQEQQQQALDARRDADRAQHRMQERRDTACLCTLVHALK